MRVAVYTRVSTTDQSTEIQLREINQYLAFKGLSAIKVYEDKATGTNVKRPKLQALLTDVRSGRYDLVVCWKLDRLFRSLKDLIVTLQEFTDLDVKFISIKDNIDLTTSAGRLMLHILGAFGEFEASLIRERVKAGLANAKAKGIRLGAAPRFDRTLARQMRLEGKSLVEIAGYFSVTKQAVHKALTARK